MRIVLYTAFCLCLVNSANCQVVKSQKGEKVNHFFKIDGPLLRYFTYCVYLDKDMYATFNGDYLERYSGNCFLLNSKENGLIKFLRINRKDTTTVGEEFLNFRLPTFIVRFCGMTSVDMVTKRKLDNPFLQVEFDNNECNVYIPIDTVELLFTKNNHIEKRVFIGDDIPKEILEELRTLSGSLIIINIQIKLQGDLIKLPPAVFKI